MTCGEDLVSINVKAFIALILGLSALSRTYTKNKFIRISSYIVQCICSMLMITIILSNVDSSYKKLHSNTEFDCIKETTVLNNTHYTYKLEADVSNWKEVDSHISWFINYVTSLFKNKTPVDTLISNSSIVKTSNWTRMHFGNPPEESCEKSTCWYNGCVLTPIRLNNVPLYAVNLQQLFIGVTISILLLFMN